jgi:hypothetical protein
LEIREFDRVNNRGRAPDRGAELQVGTEPPSLGPDLGLDLGT